MMVLVAIVHAQSLQIALACLPFQVLRGQQLAVSRLCFHPAKRRFTAT
jgi:hypothetical protein